MMEKWKKGLLPREIVYMIVGENFSMSDLKSLVLVSKAWRDTFTDPHFWRDFTLTTDKEGVLQGNVLGFRRFKELKAIKFSEGSTFSSDQSRDIFKRILSQGAISDVENLDLSSVSVRSLKSFLLEKSQ